MCYVNIYVAITILENDIPIEVLLEEIHTEYAYGIIISSGHLLQDFATITLSQAGESCFVAMMPELEFIYTSP